MRYQPHPDRRLPSTYVRHVGPSFPVPSRLPPGYSESLTVARRYTRAYSRHSRVYQAFGPIPHQPRPIRSDMITDHPTETYGGKLMLTAALVIILIVALGFGLGSLVAPKATPPLPPDTSYSVIGGPSVSAAFIDSVLKYYGSPAAGQGQAMYDLGVKYGVDPAFALAFFMHESTFGKAGMATVTYGLGNERCIPDRSCINTQGGQCQAGQSCYAQFSSWADGFEHWYQLITGPVYKGSSLTTVDTIIPRYAPNSDNNNEAGYIAFLKHAVDTWRKGTVVVS